MRKFIPAFLLLAITAALAVSCQSESPGPSAFETAVVKNSIDSLWTRYAYASDKRDSTAFGALFTEDASLVFSNAPTVNGRAAIARYLADAYRRVDATGVHVEQEDIEASGFLAEQSGTFREDFLQENHTKSRYGRFALIAERGGDHVWRIRRLVMLVDKEES